VANFEDLRTAALALPAAEEVETWGDRTFRVRGKIFAIGGPQSERVSVKASLADQTELVAADPRTYQVAPYTGRYGWVSVELSGVDAGELRELLVEAWRRTAPKRLVATSGL
jgi:hypothetical protein